jgi:tetratricopeptide (TPR) repeat protein
VKVSASFLQNIAGCILWLASSVAFAASGSISGTVRDQAGKPVANVQIRLFGGQIPPVDRQTTSGAGGEFFFSEVPAGEYELRAESASYIKFDTSGIKVQRGPGPVQVTVILQTALENGSGSAGKPPLQLQASGLRGLIDPGGYSASANSGATSGLLKGIADVERTGELSDLAAADFPCDSEPALRRAVEDAPNQESYRKLGEFYAMHARMDEAIRLLQKASQLGPTDYKTSLQLGEALLEDRRFEEARDVFTGMVGRDDLPEVHQKLAQAYEGLGMFQQAADEYANANSQKPNEAALFGQGYELLLAGRLADALRVYEEGMSKYPQSTRIRLGKGTAQFFLGQVVESVNTFVEASDLDPADSRTYPLLAAATGTPSAQNVRVVASFRRFLELAPENAQANYFYALALSRVPEANNGTQIESLLRKAIQIDAEMTNAHILLAQSYSRRNNFADAIPEYEAAIRLEPNASEPHYQLANAFNRTGHTEESAQQLQLFQTIKTKETSASGQATLDLSQFISVTKSAIKPNDTAVACAPVTVK